MLYLGLLTSILVVIILIGLFKIKALKYEILLEQAKYSRQEELVKEHKLVIDKAVGKYVLLRRRYIELVASKNVSDKNIVACLKSLK